MKERLIAIEEKYNELQKELNNPDIISDVKKMLKLNKEIANLKEPYDAYQRLKKIDGDRIFLFVASNTSPMLLLPSP